MGWGSDQLISRQMNDICHGGKQHMVTVVVVVVWGCSGYNALCGRMFIAMTQICGEPSPVPPLPPSQPHHHHHIYLSTHPSGRGDEAQFDVIRRQTHARRVQRDSGRLLFIAVVLMGAISSAVSASASFSSVNNTNDVFSVQYTPSCGDEQDISKQTMDNRRSPVPRNDEENGIALLVSSFLRCI